MAVEMQVQDKSLIANLGEIKISSDPEITLSCLGVGSCIAVCMYDPVAKVAGMAHVVLPISDNSARARGNGTKYADMAIPEMLKQLRDAGAIRSRLVVKIAGGAKMFKAGVGATMETGKRNDEAVRKVLGDEALKISSENTGGTKGRTVRLFTDSGKVTVKTVGGQELEL